MKSINIVLAIALLISCMTVFASCNKSGTQEDTTAATATTSANTAPSNRKVTGDLHRIVEAVNAKASYDGLVQEFLYKEADTDDTICWVYGIVDMNAYEHLTDYVVTLPTDYNQTFALLVFDDEMTDADYEQVIEAMKEEYIHARASALQMYKPEEYEIMAWAEENPDLVFRRYDNAIALVIYGQGEATEIWNALESAAFTN